MINTLKCPFCIPNPVIRGEILFEDDLWYYITAQDGELKHGGMIITKRHITTPFEINQAEWTRLHELLPTFKTFIDDHEPHGYNLGWNIKPVGGQNVEHAHLHFIGRYEDEPLAGKGIRYAFKQPSNQRPSNNAADA